MNIRITKHKYLIAVIAAAAAVTAGIALEIWFEPHFENTVNRTEYNENAGRYNK